MPFLILQFSYCARNTTFQISLNENSLNKICLTCLEEFIKPNFVQSKKTGAAHLGVIDKLLAANQLGELITLDMRQWERPYLVGMSRPYY